MTQNRQHDYHHCQNNEVCYMLGSNKDIILDYYSSSNKYII